MRKSQKRLLLSLFLLIIVAVLYYYYQEPGSGNRITGGTVLPNPIDTQSGPVEVYFCPHESCSTHLETLLSSANKSIHCAFYELELESIIKVLDDKSRSIDVKVVVDNQYYDQVDDHSFVRQDDDNQYSHNKFCIVDGKIVSTGSFNPTFRCAFKNNNNFVILYSTVLADNYEMEFNELWNGQFGKGGLVQNPVVKVGNVTVKNYFCPEDHCADRIEDEIKAAKESIYFMTFSFTHGGIADELILAKQRGVEVKGIFEKSQNSQYNKKPLLANQGIETRWDNNSANMHNKVFIIDKKIVITGSFNPSKNADEDNDENIIIVDDPAFVKRFLDEFDYVWQVYSVSE